MNNVDESGMTDWGKVKNLFRIYRQGALLDGGYGMIWGSKIDGTLFIQEKNVSQDNDRVAQIRSYTRLFTMSLPPFLLYLTNSSTLEINRGSDIIITVLSMAVLWLPLYWIDLFFELKGSKLQKVSDLLQTTTFRDEADLKRGFRKAQKTYISRLVYVSSFTILFGVAFYFLPYSDSLFIAFGFFAVLTFLSIDPKNKDFIRWTKAKYGK